MTMMMLSWCSNPSIIAMHKIRLICHIGLLVMAIFMLSSTSIVLAYSIKMYQGVFLHSVPEILAASAVSLILLALAWLPSDNYPGSYGLDCMRSVWQELLWSGLLSLGIAAGLASLHESTPGLMSSCGKFFICRGYITIFVATWLAWMMITIPTLLLLAGVIYQLRNPSVDKQSVWKSDMDRFEYFWPGQTHLKSIKRLTAIHNSNRNTVLPRVQPDLGLTNGAGSGLPFHDEKNPSGLGFHNL